MERLNRFLKIVKRSLIMYASSSLEFRMQIISWVISDSIYPLILAVVWNGSVYSSSSNFSTMQIFTYFFLMVFISKFTKDWSDRYVGDKIMHGEFSNYLVKPYNYLAEVMGMSIGSKIVRIITTFPFLVLIYFVLKNYLKFDLSYLSVTFTIISIAVGFGISFFLGNIFALFAFFIKQILGFRTFYENIVVFLSGEIIPIFALPIWARFITEFLPFRYTLSFPIEILGRTATQDDIAKGFLISFIWLLVLMFVYRRLFKFAVQKYEAEGI